MQLIIFLLSSESSVIVHCSVNFIILTSCMAQKCVSFLESLVKRVMGVNWLLIKKFKIRRFHFHLVLLIDLSRRGFKMRSNIVEMLIEMC